MYMVMYEKEETNDINNNYNTNINNSIGIIKN